MNYKLKMMPIELGGTWVCDYDPSQQDLIERAMINTNREDIILCSKPYSTVGYAGLHFIGENYDLSDFWNECNRLQSEDKN